MQGKSATELDASIAALRDRILAFEIQAKDFYRSILKDRVDGSLTKAGIDIHNLSNFSKPQTSPGKDSESTPLSNANSTTVTSLPEIGVQFSKKELDAKLGTSIADRTLKALPPLAVEVLLEQAAQLVDRAVIDDAARRQMMVERFNLALDNDEYKQLQEIHDQEIEAGVYKVPFWEIAANADSEAETLKWRTQYAQRIETQQDRQRKLAAWETEATLSASPNQPENSQPQLFGTYNPPGGEITNQGKHAGKYAIPKWVAGLISYEITDHSVELQKLEAKGQTAASTKRSAHLKEAEKYYEQDVDFRQMRRAVALIKLVRRIKEATEPEGILTLTPKILDTEARIKKDLADAYLRIAHSAIGIRVVFGLTHAPLPHPGTSDFLEACVIWLRTEMERIRIVTIYDQPFTLRVLLNNASVTTWNFEIDAKQLSGLKYPRLRGVSVFSQLKNSRYVVPTARLRIKAPGQGTQAEPIAVPECFIGRVGTEDATLPPELGGSRVWFNASPIGKWEVTLLPGSDTRNLANLVVDLNLVVQAA